MQSKSLLIAMAAFAVTATGVHAYTGPKVLARAGLSGEQISAFTTARELKEAGDVGAARDVLVEAGIDDLILLKVQRASIAHKKAMNAAIEKQDYKAFKVAIAGTPLARNMPTQRDFRQLITTHHEQKVGKQWYSKHTGKQGRFTEMTNEQREALTVARQSNDKEAVKAILAEAGVIRLVK